MSKTALITGASRGIGAAIAEGFAKEGYDLILVAHRSADLIKDISKRLNDKYGVSCTYHVGDLGDSTFVDRIFDSMDELDVLVNNAGISHIGLLQDMTDEEWHRVMATNLDSVFYTVDFAELSDGSWKVIETGDGGVSGLSDGQDAGAFYRSLYWAFKSEG